VHGEAPARDRELEARLAERLHAGDMAGAATAVLTSLGPCIRRYLRSMLRDEAAAADAFSQWSENVWRGLPSFRRECSLRTWTFRLAHNAAVNLHDLAWRRHATRLATGEASRLGAEIRTRTAVRVERQRHALSVLRAALEADERSLLTLRIDQELSWAEIAAVLSTPGRSVDPVALKKRFERLKDRLAALAREQGLVE
jgi:RNA polymerase sigma-70 factor (ECF subfamily)